MGSMAREKNGTIYLDGTTNSGRVYHVEIGPDGTVVTDRSSADPAEMPSIKSEMSRVNERKLDPGKPGTVLHGLIECKVGQIRCGECYRFALWMNEQGWLKCLTVHRQAILNHLKREAEARGFEWRGVWRELMSSDTHM